MKKNLCNIYPWLNISDKIYKIYKKSNYWYNRKKYNFAKYYAYKIYRRYGCWISPGAQIGNNLSLPHPIGIVIGAGAIIGNNVTIYQNVTIGRKKKDINEYPIVMDNVTIYCNSTLIGNISIESNTIIGCNSVILRNVKSKEIVHGIVK